MCIGELATYLGLNPKTIRYYEEIGLLPQAECSESSNRLYTRRDIERLGFIRRARTLALSLDEIRDILSVRQEGSPPRGQVLSLIDTKISTIEQRIVELQDFRTELATLRVTWSDEGDILQRHATPACICPIIEQQDEVTDYPTATHDFETALHRRWTSTSRCDTRSRSARAFSFPLFNHFLFSSLASLAFHSTGTCILREKGAVGS